MDHRNMLYREGSPDEDVENTWKKFNSVGIRIN